MKNYLFIALFISTLLQAQEFECISKSKAESLGEDVFSGVHRQIAKISFVLGKKTESFSNLKSFMATLEDDEGFSDKYSLSKDCNEDRCIAEQRNVVIDTIYILGYKYEDDRDYHLITSNSNTDVSYLFNIEVSGIPAQKNYYSSAILKQVRQTFEGILDKHNTYKEGSYKFFTKPIRASIGGSIFYDVDHKPGVVGPKGFRPKTSWEIHPVTSIRVF